MGGIQKCTAGKVNGDREEVNDIVKYTTINDVPEWGKSTIKKLVDAKALTGDGKGNLNVSEDFCRIMVVLDRLGKLV